MRFRNTVAIAVLFLALGAYLYFVESEKIREEGKKDRLVTLEADDVAGVVLEYPKTQQKIALRKTAAGWRLQEPLEADGDETAVDNLVRAIADAELKRTLEGEIGAPETYGLATPEAVVHVELDDGGKLPPIRVGKTTPVGYSTFVQLEGESTVKLVSSAFSTGMKKEVKDLRDKVILEFEDKDVKRIELASDESRFTLARDGERWKIDEPQALAADDSEVRTFLSSLRSVRAQEFFDDAGALDGFGLDRPRRRITLVVGKDDARKELLVGAEKERDGKKELYVKRAGSDTVYGIGSYAWSNLGKTLDTFRDKTVLSVKKAEIGAIEVVRADGESFRVARAAAKPAETPTPAEAGKETKPAAVDEDDWIVDGAGERSKEAQVGQLVGDLQGLKGYEIAAEKPADLAVFGLASPTLSFSVLDRQGKPLGRVLVSQIGGEGDAEKKAYAMAEGGDLVFRIRDYLYSHLDKKRVDLVEPETQSATPTPTASPAS
ncbi:MAG: DUF4340 domain-containing protein [Candidatus Binatia bacterium]